VQPTRAVLDDSPDLGPELHQLFTPADEATDGARLRWGSGLGDHVGRRGRRRLDLAGHRGELEARRGGDHVRRLATSREVALFRRRVLVQLERDRLELDADRAR
jgi:hypothetical protein